MPKRINQSCAATGEFKVWPQAAVRFDVERRSSFALAQELLVASCVRKAGNYFSQQGQGYCMKSSDVERSTQESFQSELEYQEFVEALLKGDRKKCSQIIADYLEQGAEAFDLYLFVFQKALYEIGEKWERAEISVADEHVATAIVDELISVLYPSILKSPRNYGKALIGCVEEEYHQIGAKMVADVLEMEGWDTLFIGAGIPTEDLIARAKSYRPDIVGLSVSRDRNLGKLEKTLAELRVALPSARFIVGGQALLGIPEDVRRQTFNAEFTPSIAELRVLLRQRQAG